MARLFIRALRGRVPTLAVASRYEGEARRLAKALGVEWAPLEGARAFDDVLLAIPSRALPEAAELVSKNMSPGSTIMDISSVKVGVVERVEERVREGVNYVSLHPLFGPAARKLQGCSIVVTPVRVLSEEALSPIVETLRSIGLRVVSASADEHDRIMSILQVAHHMMYLSLALAIWRSLDLGVVADFRTRSLKRTFSTLKSLSRNLTVIKEIQELNAYRGQAKEKLVECIERLTSGDPQAWADVERALRGLSQIP